MTIQLTPAQINQLIILKNQPNYPEAYRYLRDIVITHEGNSSLARWLDVASHVNANDGSAISDFVRNATYQSGINNGIPIGSSQFQKASDALAAEIISKIVVGNPQFGFGPGQIPSIGHIVNEDVRTIVKELNLPAHGWAGTLGAWAPYFKDIGGLNLNFDSPFYSKLCEKYLTGDLDDFWAGLGMIKEAIDNSLVGFGNIGALLDFVDRVMDYIDGTLDNIRDIGSPILDFLHNLTIAESTPPPVIRRDPLTLDLNHNGIIDLIPLNNSNTFFDITEDGTKNKVGWVGGNDTNHDGIIDDANSNGTRLDDADGFLVLDANNNGVVDNINELFGYSNPDGSVTTGTQELSTYDFNHDGKIDSNDIDANDNSIFSQLTIWQDLNGNGITDAGFCITDTGFFCKENANIIFRKNETFL